MNNIAKVIVPIVALMLAGGAAPASANSIPCMEKMVAAPAIRSTEDVEAYVQCAYEYAMEMGFDEARRAFQEDERWKSGQFYVFVITVAPIGGQSRFLVFPPDPSREGQLSGDLTDGFGTDLIQEFTRTMGIVDRGWVYYQFTNPENGLNEPKASYIMRMEWEGEETTIGAGIYRRDFPGTCHAAQVNARALEAEQSMPRLAEFVRCAAMQIESKGNFATMLLEKDPRWRDGSIYLFGLDMMGNQLFSGNPLMNVGSSGLPIQSDNQIEMSGGRVLEWGRDPKMLFRGRDMVDVAGTFGETYIHYMALHPETGRWGLKTAFVKRVTAHGVPILVGAGIYVD